MFVAMSKKLLINSSDIQYDLEGASKRQIKKLA